MSFRNRRSLRLRPVQSIKHIVDTNGAVTAGTVSTNDIIKEDASVDYKVSSVKVESGSTVHAVFLNVQVVLSTPAGGVNNIYLAVVKNPGAQIIFPVLNQLGNSAVRKFVIHQEMVMLGNGVDQGSFIAKTLFKGVILIPPRLKRFGIDDKMSVLIQHRSGEATQQTDFCLQCIYKEFQ